MERMSDVFTQNEFHVILNQRPSSEIVDDYGSNDRAGKIFCKNELSTEQKDSSIKESQ